MQKRLKKPLKPFSMPSKKPSTTERRCVGLREDVWDLVQAEAKKDFPHEKPDVSRQARLLIREALELRQNGKRIVEAKSTLAAPASCQGRHTVNLRQDVWNLVEAAAKEDVPQEEPDISRQTRVLLSEAITARRAGIQN